MRLVILILTFSIFLIGCSDLYQDKVATVASNENEHINISFLEYEQAEVEGQSGFFLSFSIEQKNESYYLDKDFAYTLQRTISDQNGNQFESIMNETLQQDKDGTPLEEGSLIFRQFFTPTLKEDSSFLSFTLYVRPLYYKQSVIFHDLDEAIERETINDLTVTNITVHEKDLHISVQDVHNTQGMTMTMIMEGEEIYPSFSTTKHGNYPYSLLANYEFAQTIPDTFTLKFTRHRLEDIVWEFPFTISITNTNNEQ